MTDIVSVVDAVRKAASEESGEDLPERKGIEELPVDITREYGVYLTPVIVEGDAEKNLCT